MGTQIAPTRLEALLETFDRDAAACREHIRILLEKDAQAFQEGLIPALKSNSSAQGVQYVLGLLVAGDRLFEALCDPALTREEAIALLRSAMEIDPAADVNLARRLVDEASGELPPSTSGRLMEVLDKSTQSGRIMSSLLRLMRLPDPQIRSKAVLMIGRANGNIRWVRYRLDDPDARTRASAVEALWDSDTTEVRELLLTAAQDTNNRVAGNALFALYRMGAVQAVAELLRMAASEDPMFRASAAWAMGETGDRRFADALRKMICDEKAVVRKRAISALGRMRRSAASTQAGAEWRVIARLLPSERGVRQIALEVTPAEFGPLPRLVATQFALTEGGQTVYSYQAEERRATEALAFTFIIPREAAVPASSWMRGAEICLSWKRPSDVWRAIYYGAGGEGRKPPALLAAVRLS